MSCVFPAEPAELIEGQPFRTLLPVLGRAVVAAFAFTARQGHDFSHNSPQDQKNVRRAFPKEDPGTRFLAVTR
jgi:hypothetical protein